MTLSFLFLFLFDSRSGEEYPSRNQELVFALFMKVITLNLKKELIRYWELVAFRTLIYLAVVIKDVKIMLRARGCCSAMSSFPFASLMVEDQAASNSKSNFPSRS